MEHEEKVLNPQESLRVIRETIDLAKSHLSENGFHFLLWGWLVTATCLVDYYLAVIARYPGHPLAWISMALIGVPASLMYEWRREKKEPLTANPVREWYGRVWLAFGISLILVTVLSVPAHLSPVPFILVLVGFATFVSGSLLRFRPLLWGSAAAWVGAVVCLYLAPNEHLLVQAAAIVAGYLVPGYWLNIRARSRHV